MRQKPPLLQENAFVTTQPPVLPPPSSLHNPTPAVGFIGAGRMASAIIERLLQVGSGGDGITIFDVQPQAMQRWCDRGVSCAADIPALCRRSELIVLAVKPQQAATVMQHFEGASKEKTLLSIMAGISTATIMQATANPVVARVMPNTPALLGEGAAGLYFAAAVEEPMRAAIRALVDSVSKVVVECDDEELLHSVTAVSGSGPAYFFTFMQAMINSAVAMGLEEQQALDLVLQTARGAEKMARLDGLSLIELCDQVASPGGTTERALSSFAASGLEAIVSDAMNACRKRSIELCQG